MAENIAEVLQESETLRYKLKETSNKVSEADEVCILWAVLEVLCPVSNGHAVGYWLTSWSDIALCFVSVANPKPE